MCPDVATPCVKDTREEKCNNGLGTMCAQLTQLAIQGREFSPTHYRSANSAYTCDANRVVRLQDRLSEDMRKAGLYGSHMCSYCNGHVCSNIRALAVSQDSDNDS